MTESFYNKIFKRDFHKYVFFASRLIPKEDAEEVVSTIFMKLWERRDRFEEKEEPIKGFIYISISNKCRDINELKKRVSYEETLPDITDEKNVLDKMVLTEFLNELFIYIETLPASQKRVIKKILDGDTNKKIASVLKLTDVAVRNAKSKAISALKIKMLKRIVS